MKIGIDLDNTICRTTEIIDRKMKDYAKNMEVSVLDIVNDHELEHNFFKENLKVIYADVEIKRNVCDVLRRLKHKGNKLYIITARRDIFNDDIDVLGITEEWLKKNNIEVDGISIGAYDEGKVRECEKIGIDIMIDDDPVNYKALMATGIKCILYDDREKFDMKSYYATSWLEVEEMIETERKKY